MDEGRTGRGSLTLRSDVARRMTGPCAWESRARHATPLRGPRVNDPDSVRPSTSLLAWGGPGTGGPGERVPCRRALTSAGRADCGAPDMLHRGRRGEDAWNTRDRSPQHGPAAQRSFDCAALQAAPLRMTTRGGTECSDFGGPAALRGRGDSSQSSNPTSTIIPSRAIVVSGKMARACDASSGASRL